MDTINDILARAEEAFQRLDAANAELKRAQAQVNGLCREYSLATKTYAFKDWMLRKELNAWGGKRCA